MVVIIRKAKPVEFRNENLYSFEHVISVQTVKGILKGELNKNLFFAHAFNKATRGVHSCFAALRIVNADIYTAEKKIITLSRSIRAGAFGSQSTPNLSHDN